MDERVVIGSTHNVKKVTRSMSPTASSTALDPFDIPSLESLSPLGASLDNPRSESLQPRNRFAAALCSSSFWGSLGATTLTPGMTVLRLSSRVRANSYSFLADSACSAVTSSGLDSCLDSTERRRSRAALLCVAAADIAPIRICSNVKTTAINKNTTKAPAST